MCSYNPNNLIIHPGNSVDPDVVVEVTPELAGWDYADGGGEALDHWLEEYGMQNVQAINKVLAQSAVPWWEVYGG